MTLTWELGDIDCSIESLTAMLSRENDVQAETYRQRMPGYAQLIVDALSTEQNELAHKIYELFHPKVKLVEDAERLEAMRRKEVLPSMILAKIYKRTKSNVFMLGIPADHESFAYMMDVANWPYYEKWHATPLLVLPKDTSQEAGVLPAPWDDGVFRVELNRELTHPDLLEDFDSNQAIKHPSYVLFAPHADERNWKYKFEREDYLMQF